MSGLQRGSVARPHGHARASARSSARIAEAATDLVAHAAAAFEFYAEGDTLDWKAIPTVVRAGGADPSEKDLAAIRAKVAKNDHVAFSELGGAVRDAGGLVDVRAAVEALVGTRHLPAAEAKALLTGDGEEPLSEAEWRAFEELFFADGRTSSLSLLCASSI